MKHAALTLDQGSQGEPEPEKRGQRRPDVAKPVPRPEPIRPPPYPDPVDATLADSFPASDPPSWMGR